MTRGSVEQVLERLDRPAQPRQQFADELFAMLVTEFEDAPTSDGPPRPVRKLRKHRWTSPHLLGAAALLVALAVAISTVALWSSAPSALAVVEDARGRFTALPSFEATVLQRQPGAGLLGDVLTLDEVPPDREIVQHLLYDDSTHWRAETVSNSLEDKGGDFGSLRTPSSGDFVVSDGTYVGTYTSRSDSFSVGPAPAIAENRHQATSLLDPSLHDFGNYSDAYFDEHCEVLSETTFLGRKVDHIHCVDEESQSYAGGPTSDFDVLYDQDTGLVLKVESRKEGVYLEVQEIAIEPTFPAGAFEVEAPEGAAVTWTGGGEPPDRFRTKMDPSVSATISVGTAARFVVEHDGLIWTSAIQNGSGREGKGGFGHVFAIDPASNDIVSDVALPSKTKKLPRNWSGPIVSAHSLTVAGGDLWVTRSELLRPQELLRVGDGGGLSEPVAEAGVVAGDPTSLWATKAIDNFLRTSLRRIDPESGEVLDSFELDVGNAGSPPLVADGSIWLAGRKGESATSFGVGMIFRIDPNSGKVVAEIPVTDPWSLAFGEGAVWVRSASFSSDNLLTRIDPQTNEVTGRLRVSRETGEVAVGEGYVWVTNAATNSLLRVDPRSMKVKQELTVGASPWGLVVAEGSVWVANYDGTISRVTIFR